MVGDRRTYGYTLLLLLGILFVTPVFGLLVSRIGMPLTPALLGAFALVTGAYGLLTLWLDDVYRGLLIAVLVLMTVAANIPLGPLPEGVTIGPNIYVVDLLLLVLVGFTLPTWRREHFTAAHGLLALYLVWSFLLVAIAPGPQPDVMFWYAIHVTRFVLVFAVVTRGIVDNWISARGALGVVVLTVVGHALVASVQTIIGPVDGLTVLGMNTRIVASFPLGPLGTLPSGPYVGGFTGGSPFAVHLSVVIPVVIASVFVDRIPRVVALGGAAWLMFLLQLTAWDAARGALLMSLGLGLLLLGWWRTGILWNRSDRIVTASLRSSLATHWPAIGGVALLIAALWQAITFGSHPIYQPVYLDPELGQAFARSANVPGFNTRNLATRIYQYIGGLDTFLKYPLTGLGGANYYYVAGSYGDRSNMLHNLYIAVLSETGFLGAVLFFGAMAYAVAATWVVAERDNDPLFIGLLVGLVGMLALQFFQPQYLRVTSFVPVWAMFGISCGRYQRIRPSDTTDRWSNAWTRSRVRVSVVSASVVDEVGRFPERVGAALRSSRLLSPVIIIASQLSRLTPSSRALRSIKSARTTQFLFNVFRQLRNYSRESKLLK